MISVIMPCYNSADTLAASLGAMTQLKAPEGGWELIAVDNGSTDDTSAILDGFRSQLPLQILREPQPGKSRALNRGIAAASGELVVFTDDDVVPDTGWLCAYASCAAAEPGFDVFSGAIYAWWQEPPPAWVEQALPLGPAFALSRVDRERGPVAAGFVSGNNLVVRQSVLHAGLRFEEDRGPQGDSYRMGEDNAFLQAAEAAGFRAYFCPEARLGHIVSPEQWQAGWLDRRAFQYGISRGLSGDGKPPGWRWSVRKRCQLRLQQLAGVVTGNRVLARGAAWEYHELRGYLRAVTAR